MTKATWRGNPLRFAAREHRKASRDWTGWCLVFARSCYGVAARYPSAAAAWRAAEHKHPTTDPRTIPRGAPVWWLGGSGGFGHVAISTGDGWCWSTDLRRRGQVDKVPIDDVARLWGLQLVGWSEDLNGVRVYTPAVNNRVTAARELLDEAVELLDATPARRTRVHQLAGELRELLDQLPAT